MDMFDEAEAMSGALKLNGMTQARLAHELGVSQSYVANKLRLLSFSDKVKRKIREEGITERHARAVLRLRDEDEQLMMLDKVSQRRLTVRECEALVDSLAEVNITPAIGVRDKRERISTFIASVKKSLDNLSSLGINTSITKSYYGNKTYLTLTLEEDF